MGRGIERVETPNYGGGINVNRYDSELFSLKEIFVKNYDKDIY